MITHWFEIELEACLPDECPGTWNPLLAPNMRPFRYSSIEEATRVAQFHTNDRNGSARIIEKIEVWQINRHVHPDGIK